MNRALYFERLHKLSYPSIKKIKLCQLYKLYWTGVNLGGWAGVSADGWAPWPPKICRLDLLQAPCSLLNYKCNILPPPYSKKMQFTYPRRGCFDFLIIYIYPSFLNALFPYPHANCLIKNCYITTPFIAIFIIIGFCKDNTNLRPHPHQTAPFLRKGAPNHYWF